MGFADSADSETWDSPGMAPSFETIKHTDREEQQQPEQQSPTNGPYRRTSFVGYGVVAQPEKLCLQDCSVDTLPDASERLRAFESLANFDVIQLSTPP